MKHKTSALGLAVLLSLFAVAARAGSFSAEMVETHRGEVRTGTFHFADGRYRFERVENGRALVIQVDPAAGGVRIGTAEIYRQVEKVPQVIDSVAIGQQWQDDVRVVLFVKLRDGVELDEGLEQQIRQVIRVNTTPRHVPAKILAVTDIPRTISGKVVELAVRNVVHGQKVKNTDALANPEALEQFRNRSELQD